jgi:hypothetical protein
VGATPLLALPIPELTDTADGPDGYSKLGAAVENYLYARTLPTGITRWPKYHWGSGTVYPTAANGVKVGDTFIHTGLGSSLMVYGGASWRQEAPAEVANAAARTAIATNYQSLLYAGFTVIQADTGTVWRYTAGNTWRPMLPINPVRLESVSTTATWSSPNGGQINTGFTIDPTALFGPGVGARVILDGTCLVDVISGAGPFAWYYFLNSTVTGNIQSDYRSVGTDRVVWHASYTVDLAAGAAPVGFFSTLTAPGAPANAQTVRTYADYTSNRLLANVLPIFPS